MIHFSYTKLESATLSFSKTRLLGTGGFGSVYKGFIGGTTVAIKLLHKVTARYQQSFCSDIDLVIIKLLVIRNVEVRVCPNSLHF